MLSPRPSPYSKTCRENTVVSPGEGGDPDENLDASEQVGGALGWGHRAVFVTSIDACCPQPPIIDGVNPHPLTLPSFLSLPFFE